ncbi:MAG: ABC transporter ATP-binding protein/permease [Bacteroidetes bacterium]|nr:ABC transporter ATP-binding protein/permease [Bacteroidota bacterium]MBU1421659.1 ABC transporter ATP-binding protein/permease [Bacteroidota bacterium]MBU2470787.1 ABC transporter ATP-binding protein/permease [Bacteroidota bacterium]MBU2635643.1 ABC transporter ATP-binding protein/permease [Bacteroidota bacterium]
MHEEEILGKAYDARLMKRLLKSLKPYRKHVTLGILLSMLVSGLEAVRPYFTKIAVDENIAHGDKHGLLITALMFFGVLVFRGVMQYFSAYLTQWIGQRTIFDLRMQIFDHLQKLSLKFYDKNPIGRLITRVTNDVEVLNEMFSSGIVMVFTDIFTIIGILYFMFTMNWQLALVSLSVLPILFYATFLFRRKARETYRDVRLQVARINTFMQEHITGMSVDQIFNREQKSFQKFSDINASHRDANIKSIFYYAVFYPGVELIGAIAVGLIIWYSGVEALSGAITLGTVMAFFQFNEMFWRPVRDLSEKYNIMQTAMASSERIFKLLDDKSIIANPEKPVSLNSVRGDIEFRNVWFTYNSGEPGSANNEWILKDVSFKIKPGETAAIVGHTGAGKSTIINLLTIFYEIQQGEILVDGIDIRKIDQEDLRKHIGVVHQDVFLFSGDIKSNINLGNEKIKIDRVKAAARVVGLNRFIDTLPNRYHEEVKERGATLSVGQKQLISFARALAYNPKILILDEATSSVDTETELLIQNAIQKLLKGRSSIVIAHRLSTIQRADKIIVLHKGEVREIGTHQELLAQGGIYYKLYQLQYKAQEVGR